MMPDFSAWFQELWGYPPFPWQAALAGRVSQAGWPRALDLPTASGKTACMDIAIYTLAAQYERPLEERTAPRRIWFVVDRRIVVDEAFHRAAGIARQLEVADDGPLLEVARRLRALSGTSRPLAAGRLRGGIPCGDGWTRIPSQPAVITSTVDQLGSRLLFRGYGHSLLAAPVQAGLAANDSLIILDEAHCSVPFLQTLEAIGRYRGGRWAEEPLPNPFSFVVMSATPPAGVPPESIFPGARRSEVLDHPALRQRLTASKRAELVLAGRRGNENDALVDKAVEYATRFIKEGKRRVAVMVNRVPAAESAAAGLHEALARAPDGLHPDVVLLTGRLRPFERDELVEFWSPYLRARGPDTPPRPVIVVATQCLEVGADFSFDALITECASLDALRQRFGRLARMGAAHPAPAVILIRETDLNPKQPDPIYGSSLPDTWNWLKGKADGMAGKSLFVDMGVEALESRLQGEDTGPLLAPVAGAPVLLPAHLDLLCQTAPPAHPEPGVSLFLHGRPGPPEVSVLWRCDLPATVTGWPEAVSLCPPVSGEMLQAPLWRVRAWLAKEAVPGAAADVEGGLDEQQAGAGPIRPCLLWRGRDHSKVAQNAGEIAPGDVVVAPASYGIEGLGQATRSKALGSESLDLWELARAAAGHPPSVRLNPAVLAPWLGCPPVKALLQAVTSPDRNRDLVQDAIQAVLDYAQETADAPAPPPDWWLALLRSARQGRMAGHAAGGVILFGPPDSRFPAETDLFSDDDDLASAANRTVALEQHARLVRRAAEKLAGLCLPEALHGALSAAALWHDAGKLDPRFQWLLFGGDGVAAASSGPVAKSAGLPSSPARRRAIREASGLPDGFRHEMLSLALAQHCAVLPQDRWQAELALHLIASHHGHGRPFAPVAPDPAPPDVDGTLAGHRITWDASRRQAIPPAHRLDSGIPERFWRLTRRYGWWGLAYAEAVLRLSDWYASNFILEKEGDA